MKKVLLISLVVAMLAGCGIKDRSIKYVATDTTGTVDITMAGANSATEQYAGVSSGWTKTWQGKVGDFVYVSAQRNNADGGTVTVTIYCSDKLYRTASSTGAFVIATASGSAE